MPLAVFLDLYRVLADPDEMTRQYRQRMAEILKRDYGVPTERGLKVHDDAFERYEHEGRLLDQRHDEIGDGESWVKAVNDLDANNVSTIFKMLDLPFLEDRYLFAAKFEEEIVRGTDALYPDVKPSLKRLKADGHRIYLSTNASRSNGEAALVGGGVREMFDRVIVMEIARSKKDRPHYWESAFAFTKVDPKDAVVVDDVSRYLDIPAKMGTRCLQMIRPEVAHLIKRGPWPVIESMAVLPAILK